MRENEVAGTGLQGAESTRRPGTGAPAAAAHRDPARAAAEAFEAAFLAEMLRHAGLGRMPETFNGGAGEAAFAGTLVEAYANHIAGSASLGLAEQIHRALLARGAGRGETG